MKEVILLTLNEVIALATVACLSVSRTNYSRSKRDIVIWDASDSYLIDNNIQRVKEKYVVSKRGLEEKDGYIPLSMTTIISY